MIDIISVTYGQNEQLKCFINSIKSQNNKDWRLFIVHDGPNENLKKDLQMNGYLEEQKIIFLEYPKRTQNYGHILRDWALTNYVTSEYVIITNGDNYYTPNMIDEVSRRTEDFIYFDCVHSHNTKNNFNSKDYGFMNTKLNRGWIDIGCVAINSKLAKKTGFKSTHFAADWFYFEEILNKTKSIYKIDKVLFVHN